MSLPGVAYAINGIRVTAPDEEVWTPIVMGIGLRGQQKRSTYWQLEWRKTVGNSCYLDWMDYDNSVLTSLVTRPQNRLDEFETYTDVICQSVTFRHRRGMANEIVATFLVNTA